MGKAIYKGLSVDIKILSPGGCLPLPRGCLPLPRGYRHVLNHEKNCIKSDFKGIFLKLATSDKTFLLTLKLGPLGAQCPCPGATYIYIFFFYKIGLQRHFFWNSQQMTEVTRCSCCHQNFDPKGGCQPLSRGYIHVLNHEKKNCIKSDFKDRPR